MATKYAAIPFLSSQTPTGTKSNSGMGFTPTSHSDVYDLVSPTNPSNVLPADYRILITGASRGLGRATALAFAQAGAARIAVTSRSGCADLVDEIGRLGKGTEVLDFKADITSEEKVRAVAEDVKSRWGWLSAVISNAGVLHPRANITEQSPTEFLSTFNINVNGTFLTAHFFLPLLLASPSSSSANPAATRTFLAVTSAGMHFAMPGLSAYQTSKLAVTRLSEFICAEYGDKGIVSFAAHPGGVPTATSANMGEAFQSQLNDTPELCAGTFVWLLKVRREWQLLCRGFWKSRGEIRRANR